MGGHVPGSVLWAIFLSLYRNAHHLLRIVTAKTEIEAQRKYDELQSNYHLQAQLVSYAGDTGIDISRYADSDALSTHTEGMTSYVMHPDGSGKPLTAGDVKQRFAKPADQPRQSRGFR